MKIKGRKDTWAIVNDKLQTIQCDSDEMVQLHFLLIEWYKNYRSRNVDEVVLRRREYARKRYQKNKDKIAQKQREYREKNRERIRENARKRAQRDRLKRLGIKADE